MNRNRSDTIREQNSSLKARSLDASAIFRLTLPARNWEVFAENERERIEKTTQIH